MSSSSSSNSSPVPTRKRTRDSLEGSSSQDDTDVCSADEADSLDTPQRLPKTESTVLSHAERRRQKKKQKLNQLTAASESEPASKKGKLDDLDDVDASSPSNTHAKNKCKTTTKIKAKESTRAGTAVTPSTDDSRRQKRQNSVWVGNLSFQTTQDALREFFGGAGTITRVHMPMRRGKQGQGENMGFAYVDFETPDAKTIAVTLSEGVLDGRNLLIKDGDDFTGRPSRTKTEAFESTGGESRANPESDRNTVKEDGKGLSKTAQRILRAQKQPPAPTLFLGNLGFETTEESIRELFEAHRHWRQKDKERGSDAKAGEQDEGEDGTVRPKDLWIRKIRMGTFEDSGNCKGFAFADFTSIEHATEALVNPRNHRLNGRDLVVEYASPDAVRRSGLRPPKGDRDRKGKSGGSKGAATMLRTRQPQRRQNDVEQEDGGNVGEEAVEMITTTRSRRPDRVSHEKPHARRAKPGAALAHAQRQSAAILPSQGQKILF